MIKKSLYEAQIDLLRLWNEEFTFSPLTELLLEQRIFSSSLLIEEGSYALYDNEELVGVIILKAGHPKDVEQSEVVFLSLLYVNPKYRHQGLGTKILKEAGEVTFKFKKKYLLTGCEYDNLFSGVEKNFGTDSFFENLGFIVYDKNYNLITSNRLAETDAKSFRIAENEKEKDAVLNLIASNFSLRWYYDIKCVPYQDLALAIEKDKIVGFLHLADLSSPVLPNSLSFYSLYENLGGIGPLGLVPKTRGKGLGKGLVKFGVNQLFDRGCSDVLVDWTNLTDFYLKCGFERIVNQFTVYARPIPFLWQIADNNVLL